MKLLIIPIHSVSSLITNSSSEVFVSADDLTLKSVKELVDNVLIAGNSPCRAGDLFTFSLIGKRLVVMPKAGLGTSANDAAMTLSKLTDLFELEASFDS